MTDSAQRACLTLFDLDHTLIRLDSNQAWVQFLIDAKRLDARSASAGARAMEQRYRKETVEIDIEFCEFFIGTLVGIEAGDLAFLLGEFVRSRIRPAITARARDLIEAHRKAGEILAIITATNRIITRPIADALGISNLIATEPEYSHGRLTGRVAGVPSMRGGKVTRLRAWLKEGAVPGAEDLNDLKVLRFYSDSINDRALLEVATDAIAVDPDPPLAALANERGWPIISLLDPASTL
jgi:HAD superfamily hydrolase (TIGR01490 family)